MTSKSISHVRAIRKGVLLLALLFSTQSFAQGNDFPPFPTFEPNWPPWQIISPCCNNQGNYRLGTVWGPYTLWEAKKGDTVEIQVHMNWWPGPLYLSPISNGAQNMRWTGGGAWDHGVLGSWCVPDCYFAFEAGDDYPNLQLDYYAPYRWGETNGGWLQVINVIPALPTAQPKLQLYTQQQKDNAAWWSGTIGGANSYIEAANIGICATNWKLTCFGSNVAKFLASQVKDMYDGVVKDPLDPNYQFPYDPPSDVDPGILGLSWTDDNDVNQIIFSAVVVNTYAYAAIVSIDRASTCLDQGDSCWQWQHERARYFMSGVGSWSQYAANYLYVLRDGEDDTSLWYALNYLGWSLNGAGNDLQYGDY